MAVSILNKGAIPIASIRAALRNSAFTQLGDDLTLLSQITARRASKPLDIEEFALRGFDAAIVRVTQDSDVVGRDLNGTIVRYRTVRTLAVDILRDQGKTDDDALVLFAVT